MQKMILEIPKDLNFSNLKLSRVPQTGEIEFDWEPIEKICDLNGIDISLFREQSEDNVAGLIMSWYQTHLENGGMPNPVAEDLITEARLEDEHGGGISHQPGRA